jgi:hypothetical protein
MNISNGRRGGKQVLPLAEGQWLAAVAPHTPVNYNADRLIEQIHQQSWCITSVAPA